MKRPNSILSGFVTAILCFGIGFIISSRMSKQKMDRADLKEAFGEEMMDGMVHQKRHTYDLYGQIRELKGELSTSEIARQREHTNLMGRVAMSTRGALSAEPARLSARVGTQRETMTRPQMSLTSLKSVPLADRSAGIPNKDIRSNRVRKSLGDSVAAIPMGASNDQKSSPGSADETGANMGVFIGARPATPITSNVWADIKTKASMDAMPITIRTETPIQILVHSNANYRSENAFYRSASIVSLGDHSVSADKR